MSENTLDQLIESLKTEAIEAAEKESERILEEAKTKAQQIVETAENQRNSMLSEAEQESKAILNKGKIALQQAGRDYSISVRNELLQMFQAVLEAETRKNFTPNLLKDTILKLVQNIGGDAEIRLSSEDSKELADYLHNQLQSTKQIIKIKEDKNLLKGFSISHTEQGWSYTITPEDVAEALQKQLSSNWVNILKGKE